MLICSLFGLMISFILPIAMSEVSWKFYFNAGYNSIFLPIVYFVWVEDKGVALVEVDNLFLKDLSNEVSSEVLVEQVDVFP